MNAGIKRKFLCYRKETNFTFSRNIHVASFSASDVILEQMGVFILSFLSSHKKPLICELNMKPSYSNIEVVTRLLIQLYHVVFTRLIREWDGWAIVSRRFQSINTRMI